MREHRTLLGANRRAGLGAIAAVAAVAMAGCGDLGASGGQNDLSSGGRAGNGAGGSTPTTCPSTVKPGSVPGIDGKPQAPHIVMAVFGRGMTMQSMTRIYFEDEAATADDAVMNLVPADRRATIIAKKTAPGVYRFDIHLHGDNETVFFDV